jgi:hypothetical protein
VRPRSPFVAEWMGANEMPDPPAGEAELLKLAGRFELAESQIRQRVAEAALAGDRRRLLTEALAVLLGLRRLDRLTPVVTAYLTAYRAVRPGGTPTAVGDLAGSLARKLDHGARRAQAGSRRALRFATADNLDELQHVVVTAHVGQRGARWTLGRWATMNTQTIGRQATSRGLADAPGDGGRVVVHVGQCKWCHSHAGEGLIGEIPLPPYHPSCTCSAVVA